MALRVWLISAVAGGGIAGLSLATRATCRPGSARLFDLTPVLPYVFATSAVGAAWFLVLVGRRDRGRVVAGIAICVSALTLALAASTAVIARNDHVTGSHCWTAF